MARRWRRIFYSLVPSWLSSGDGEKVLYSLGLVTDAFIERTRQSLVARFPTYVGPTGLRMLGAERGIVQGRDENAEGYARRLREWRGVYGHLTRGSPYAMLRQVWNYFGGVKVQELDAAGNVYTMSREGVESATHGNFWNWDSPQPAVDVPAHDASAASDSATGGEPTAGANLVGPGDTATLTLHCDGSPGSLIFLHIGMAQAVNDTVPESFKGRGWNLAAESTASSGTGAPYTSRVYWRITGPYESFTSVVVTCTNNQTSGNVRFIGRAVNAPGTFNSEPLLEVVTATANGVHLVTPALAAPDADALALMFIQGRKTTYPAVTGWTELDAERTSGVTGIGIDEQYQVMSAGAGIAGAPFDIGATSAVNMILLTVVQKPDTPWYRFWLKLIPTPDLGIASHRTFVEGLEGHPTFGQAEAAGLTWGQTGVTAGDTAVVKNLFRGARPWKMAGTKAEWLVCVLGQDEAHAPDGTWIWPHGARPATWRFWKL